MTNIEIIKMLVNAMDTNGVQDEALKQAAVALLDNLNVAPKTDPAKAPAKKTKTEPAAKAKSAGRKGVDHGKIIALSNAGFCKSQLITCNRVKECNGVCPFEDALKHADKEMDEQTVIDHDRDWIIGCIEHDGFIHTHRFDKANQIIHDALSADAEPIMTEDVREALMRLTMCAREECGMCKYKDKCGFEFQYNISTDNMNTLSDALMRSRCEVDAKSADAEWIPCSERMPSESGDYLCTIPLDEVDTYTEVLTFHKGRFYEDDDEWGATYHDDVIAWMPLPKPYREDGEV